MGNTCGHLNANQTAVVTTWTDKHVQHGPVSCFCYPPGINSVAIVPMLELKMNQYAVVEDARNPTRSHCIHGPILHRLDNAYQTVSKPAACPVLDQNDYIIVTNREGVKRTVIGPTVFKPEYGEKWTQIEEAIILQMNQFIVVKDNANRDSPIRHVRGPAKFYPSPYDEIVKDGQSLVRSCPAITDTSAIWLKRTNGKIDLISTPQYFMPEVGESIDRIVQAVSLENNQWAVVKDNNNTDNPIQHIRGPIKFFLQPYTEIVPGTAGPIRACQAITDTTAIWLRRNDGKLHLIDKQQYFMPAVGEIIDRTVEKTILKESEFAIIISPSGENMLKLGKEASQRAFFLPPYYSFLKFKIGDVEQERFTTLPTYIPNEFTVRTSDNVQVRIDLRISFQVIEPIMYAVKPIDFYTQIRYWIQNAMLDAYAKVSFRDFMRVYADTAISETEQAHKRFNEYGIHILDVQVINFKCDKPETQALIDNEIAVTVKKQSELRARELDVTIMGSEQAVQSQRKEIDLANARKDNEIAMQRKEMELVNARKDNEMALQRRELELALKIKEKETEVALRRREVELQTDEERARQELLEIKQANAVKEGSFEGRAQGESVRAFLDSLPADLPMPERVALWNQLRDLERTVMLYSKVDKVQVMPPGADVKQFNLIMDEPSRELARSQPLMMPAILGYSHDSTAVAAVAAATTAAAMKKV